MTDTENATIEGRPITGEISKGHRGSTEQWDAPKFLEMLDAVLNTPGVVSVAWRQYTPFFNDGEVCEFGVYGFEAEVTDAPEGSSPETERYDYDTDTEHVYFSSYAFYDYVDGVRTPNHPVFGPLEALGDASDHFEDVLYEYFGDHAHVFASRDGFAVETYEHD